MKKRKLISFDFALKRLLRSKANFEVLEGFLSELLKQDVTVNSILESESNKKNINSKQNRVDLMVELLDGEKVIVEIQFCEQYDYFHRMLFGTSQVITESIESGIRYGNICKVISINIVYFELGHGNDYIYHGKTEFKGIHNDDILELSNSQKELFPLINNISDIWPEYYILKINGFDNVAKNTLDEWIYFLKNEEIKPEFKAKGLKKAEEVMDYVKLSLEEQAEYDSFLDERRSIESILDTSLHKGRTEGKAEGKAEERLLIAGKLLDILSDEQISQKTGISIEEVRKLREEK